MSPVRVVRNAPSSKNPDAYFAGAFPRFPESFAAHAAPAAGGHPSAKAVVITKVSMDKHGWKGDSQEVQGKGKGRKRVKMGVGGLTRIGSLIIV